MAITINFDTPQSSTSYSVPVSGTVAAGSIGHLTISLNVTNTATASRNHTLYREIDFDNSAGGAPLVISASYTLSVVPKLLGSDTILSTGSSQAWSYS